MSTDRWIDKWIVVHIHNGILFSHFLPFACDNFSHARIAYTQYDMGFPGGSDGKESACNAGDPGLIPGWGISPGGERCNPLQYSCLENPMNRGAWWATVRGVAKSHTAERLSTAQLWHDSAARGSLLLRAPVFSEQTSQEAQALPGFSEICSPPGRSQAPNISALLTLLFSSFLNCS